jgi:archaellum biogenesis ATPase FlaH
VVTVVVKDFTYCQEEFMKQVKENNLSISPEMIMRLLRIAMVVVDKTNESGNKKKEFVINLLKEVVMKNNDISPEDKLQALHLIMGNIVSDSIDFLIDASKGKFDVNKIENIAQEVAISCFARCFERFSKKK